MKLRNTISRHKNGIPLEHNGHDIEIVRYIIPSSGVLPSVSTYEVYIDGEYHSTQGRLDSASNVARAACDPTWSSI